MINLPATSDLVENDPVAKACFDILLSSVKVGEKIVVLFGANGRGKTAVLHRLVTDLSIQSPGDLAGPAVLVDCSPETTFDELAEAARSAVGLAVDSGASLHRSTSGGIAQGLPASESAPRGVVVIDHAEKLSGSVFGRLRDLQDQVPKTEATLTVVMAITHDGEGHAGLEQDLGIADVVVRMRSLTDSEMAPFIRRCLAEGGFPDLGPLADNIIGSVTRMAQGNPNAAVRICNAAISGQDLEQTSRGGLGNDAPPEPTVSEPVEASPLLPDDDGLLPTAIESVQDGGAQNARIDVVRRPSIDLAQQVDLDVPTQRSKSGDGQRPARGKGRLKVAGLMAAAAVGALVFAYREYPVVQERVDPLIANVSDSVTALIDRAMPEGATTPPSKPVAANDRNEPPVGTPDDEASSSLVADSMGRDVAPVESSPVGALPAAAEVGESAPTEGTKVSTAPGDGTEDARAAATADLDVAVTSSAASSPVDSALEPNGTVSEDTLERPLEAVGEYAERARATPPVPSETPGSSERAVVANMPTESSEDIETATAALADDILQPAETPSSESAVVAATPEVARGASPDEPSSPPSLSPSPPSQPATAAAPAPPLMDEGPPENQVLSMIAPRAVGEDRLMASDEQVAAWMRQGDDLVDLGDIVSARSFYRLAAEAGSTRAIGRTGMTYDPLFQVERGVVGDIADPRRALLWYKAGAVLGDGFSADRLEALVATLRDRAERGDAAAASALGAAGF